MILWWISFKNRWQQLLSKRGKGAWKRGKTRAGRTPTKPSKPPDHNSRSASIQREDSSCSSLAGSPRRWGARRCMPRCLEEEEEGEGSKQAGHLLSFGPSEETKKENERRNTFSDNTKETTRLLIARFEVRSAKFYSLIEASKMEVYSKRHAWLM